MLRHEKLSRREFNVLLLLAGGKAVGDIARELSISPKTVSTHKVRLSEKNGLSLYHRPGALCHRASPDRIVAASWQASADRYFSPARRDNDPPPARGRLDISRGDFLRSQPVRVDVAEDQACRLFSVKRACIGRVGAGLQVPRNLPKRKSSPADGLTVSLLACSGLLRAALA